MYRIDNYICCTDDKGNNGVWHEVWINRYVHGMNQARSRVGKSIALYTQLFHL